MDLTKKIGYRVVNKKGEEGTIVEVNDHIKVDFGSKTALFPMNTFIKGFLLLRMKHQTTRLLKQLNKQNRKKPRLLFQRKIINVMGLRTCSAKIIMLSI